MKQIKNSRVLIIVSLTMIIVTVTVIVCKNFEHDTLIIEQETSALQDEQFRLQAINSEMQKEVNAKDSDDYIMDTARTFYGYLMPGEIRFKVSNIDDLYADQEVEIDEVGL